MRTAAEKVDRTHAYPGKGEGRIGCQALLLKASVLCSQKSAQQMTKLERRKAAKNRNREKKGRGALHP